MNPDDIMLEILHVLTAHLSYKLAVRKDMGHLLGFAKKMLSSYHMKNEGLY